MNRKIIDGTIVACYQFIVLVGLVQFRAGLLLRVPPHFWLHYDDPTGRRL
jgi:hypothetical protein